MANDAKDSALQIIAAEMAYYYDFPRSKTDMSERKVRALGRQQEFVGAYYLPDLFFKISDLANEAFRNNDEAGVKLARDILDHWKRYSRGEVGGKFLAEKSTEALSGINDSAPSAQPE